MTTLAALQSLVAQGESETLELERSSTELRRAGDSLCATLNGEGGKVLFGVGLDGRCVGQEVANITRRVVAAMRGRYAPPAPVEMSRMEVGGGRQVIVLDAAPSRGQEAEESMSIVTTVQRVYIEFQRVQAWIRELRFFQDVKLNPRGGE